MSEDAASPTAEEIQRALDWFREDTSDYYGTVLCNAYMEAIAELRKLHDWPGINNEDSATYCTACAVLAKSPKEDNHD